ncbi:MAG: Rossmann-like and DUF2520 domain-containing protein [bacterium]
MTTPNTQHPTPSVSIIGAGRLGQALAIALHSHGYPIPAVVTKTAAHAKNAAASISRWTLALAANQLEQLPPSDLVLIATPDDVIESIAKQLAVLRRGMRHRATFLHTSGALSSAALSPLAKAGFHTGSMHPLVSISDPLIGAQSLHGAFYCLEGDATALRAARLLVRDLRGTSFSIAAKDKPLYHAAAVMASPHLVALFDLASQMLVACGLKEPRAREILLPLVESTLKNLRVSDPEHALTGTFARGDFATVAKHLKALSQKETRSQEVTGLRKQTRSQKRVNAGDGRELALAREVYKLLGLHSLELAEQNGLDPQLLKQIKKLLRHPKGISR